MRNSCSSPCGASAILGILTWQRWCTDSSSQELEIIYLRIIPPPQSRDLCIITESGCFSWRKCWLLPIYSRDKAVFWITSIIHPQVSQYLISNSLSRLNVARWRSCYSWKRCWLGIEETIYLEIYSNQTKAKIEDPARQTVFNPRSKIPRLVG